VISSRGKFGVTDRNSFGTTRSSHARYWRRSTELEQQAELEVLVRRLEALTEVRQRQAT
jgi:hypothetical protein